VQWRAATVSMNNEAIVGVAIELICENPRSHPVRFCLQTPEHSIVYK
jgi:hypothetical protein